MKTPLSSRGGFPSSGDTQLAMTSMIDVVFLLLVFFLWTSSFDLPEMDLRTGVARQAESSPTGAGSPQPPDEREAPKLIDEVVVQIATVDGQVRVQIGGQNFSDMATVRARFQQIALLGVDVPIVIDPDEQIEMRLAIEVLDTARQAGLARVYFAAS